MRRATATNNRGPDGNPGSLETALNETAWGRQLNKGVGVPERASTNSPAAELALLGKGGCQRGRRDDAGVAEGADAAAATLTDLDPSSLGPGEGVGNQPRPGTRHGPVASSRIHAPTARISVFPAATCLAKNPRSKG